MPDHRQRLLQVPGVDMHLPAAHLAGREHHLVTQPLQQRHGGLGDVREQGVTQAGGDQCDTHESLPTVGAACTTRCCHSFSPVLPRPAAGRSSSAQVKHLWAAARNAWSAGWPPSRRRSRAISCCQRALTSVASIARCACGQVGAFDIPDQQPVRRARTASSCPTRFPAAPPASPARRAGAVRCIRSIRSGLTCRLKQYRIGCLMTVRRCGLTAARSSRAQRHRSPVEHAVGAGLHQQVAQRGGLDRAGDDRQAGRVGDELAQQLVLRAAADDVDDVDPPPGQPWRVLDSGGERVGQAVQDAAHDPGR